MGKIGHCPRAAALDHVAAGCRPGQSRWLQFLKLTVAMAVFWLWPALADAQNFPSRPVRMLIPAAAGTGVDIVTRAIALQLEAKWSQPVVVLNQAGGGGAIAVSTLISAPADGHTLLATPSTGITLIPQIVRGGSFAPSDLVPVGLLATDTIMLVSTPQGRLKTIEDVRRAARPGEPQIRFGSAAAGSAGHVIGTRLGILLGQGFIHVPYRDFAIGLRDLAAGDIELFFSSGGSLFRQVASGALHGVAVSDERRRGCVPDVKTFMEQGLDLYIPFWLGVFSTPGTPKAVVSVVNADINAVLATPRTVQAFAGACLEPTPRTPEAFVSLVQQDLAIWKALLSETRIEIE